jgi:hypothetical protein
VDPNIALQFIAPHRDELSGSLGQQSRHGVSQKADITDEHFQAYKKRFTPRVPKKLALQASENQSTATSFVDTKRYPFSASIDGESIPLTAIKQGWKRPAATEANDDEDVEGAPHSSTCGGADDNGGGGGGGGRPKAAATCGGADGNGGGGGGGGGGKKHCGGSLRAPLSEPDFERVKPVSSWTSTEFLSAKQGLKFKCAELVIRLDGKKGMIAALKGFEAEAVKRNCAMDDLPMATADLLGVLEPLAKQAVDVDLRAQTVKKHEYSKLKEEYVTLLLNVDKNGLAYDEQTEAIKYKLKGQGEESRKDYQRDHWQMQKIQQHLVRGGMPEGVAKHMAGKIFLFDKSRLPNSKTTWHSTLSERIALNPTKETFGRTKIAIFATLADSDPPEGAAFFESVAGSIHVKYLGMQEAMDENPRWLGSMGKVQCQVDPEAFELVAAGVSDSEGGGLYMAVFNANLCRHGPFATPLPILPALFYGSSDEVVWLHFHDVAAFLKLGITLDALGEFLSSSAGANYMEKNSFAIPLMKGCTVFVPVGFAVYVTSSKVLSRAQRPPLVSFCHLPLGGEFVQGTPIEIKNVIHTCNSPHLLQKASTSPMWAARSDWYSKVHSLMPF